MTQLGASTLSTDLRKPVSSRLVLPEDVTGTVAVRGDPATPSLPSERDLTAGVRGLGGCSP